MEFNTDDYIVSHWQYETEMERLKYENELRNEITKQKIELEQIKQSQFLMNLFNASESADIFLNSIKKEKPKQEPFIVIYTTGKIGGDGFFKDCELEIIGLNPEYNFEE